MWFFFPPNSTPPVAAGMVSLKSNRIVQLLTQSAMKSFSPATLHDRNTPATGQITPGDATGARLSEERGHFPWNLSHAALDGSSAWHVEMRRETKAVAHKVVIFPPRLLLPHVGFHSISIASQQLHVQHLFYYI